MLALILPVFILQWVSKQRMLKKFKEAGEKTNITDAQIEKLEKIGFTWAKRNGPLNWALKYRELCEFNRLHGHCDVPTKFRVNRALGRWVSTQRAEYKKFREGQPSPMTSEKIEQLGNLNFQWKCPLKKTAPNAENPEDL